MGRKAKPKKKIDHDTVDTAAVTEMILFAENTESLYTVRQRYQRIAMNRMIKGTYDHAKAEKLWWYYADRVRHAYRKEFCHPQSRDFSKVDAEAVAKYFQRDFETDVLSGEITPDMLGVKGEVPKGIAF